MAQLLGAVLPIGASETEKDCFRPSLLNLGSPLTRTSRRNQMQPPLDIPVRIAFGPPPRGAGPGPADARHDAAGRPRVRPLAAAAVRLPLLLARPARGDADRPQRRRPGLAGRARPAGRCLRPARRLRQPPDGRRRRRRGLADDAAAGRRALRLVRLAPDLDRRARAAGPLRRLRRSSTSASAPWSPRSCKVSPRPSAGSWSARRTSPTGCAPTRRCASTPRSSPASSRSNPTTRPDAPRALELIERHDADRVVISTAHADDAGLLNLVRAFKAVGVPVSMLPRPLDLLEAPATRPTRIGGVPLIEVELARRPRIASLAADPTAASAPAPRRSPSSSRR